MSFTDLAEAAMRQAALGPAGEVLDLKHIPSGAIESTVAWVSARGVVSDSEAELQGRADVRGPRPFTLYLEKTLLPSINLQVDRVRRKGVVFRVLKIISDDPGIWTLYCAQ
jgi:hypothetical protein